MSENGGGRVVTRVITINPSWFIGTIPNAIVECIHKPTLVFSFRHCEGNPGVPLEKKGGGGVCVLMSAWRARMINPVTQTSRI